MHQSKGLLVTGFLVQIVLAAAAIAIGIEFDTPKWFYIAGLILPFLCGGVFVLGYRYERPLNRLVAIGVYILSSVASLFMLTLLLFCSMKTCS